MASEAISEHLISENFHGGVCPQTPLVLHSCACIHVFRSDVHVTSLRRILATGLATTALLYGTPNATKISCLCRLDRFSFSQPCCYVWIEARSRERRLYSRFQERSKDRFRERSRERSVASFPGRSRLQCFITGSMQKTEEEDLGDGVTCVT